MHYPQPKMNHNSPKDPESIFILTIKLLYTYFWKTLPIGALIWLAPIWLIWAQIVQPTWNYPKREKNSSLWPVLSLVTSETKEQGGLPFVHTTDVPLKRTNLCFWPLRRSKCDLETRFPVWNLVFVRGSWTMCLVFLTSAPLRTSNMASAGQIIWKIDKLCWLQSRKRIFSWLVCCPKSARLHQERMIFTERHNTKNGRIVFGSIQRCDEMTCDVLMDPNMWSIHHPKTVNITLNFGKIKSEFTCGSAQVWGFQYCVWN